jgi:hypothetical protein
VLAWGLYKIKGERRHFSLIFKLAILGSKENSNQIQTYCRKIEYHKTVSPTQKYLKFFPILNGRKNT